MLADACHEDVHYGPVSSHFALLCARDWCFQLTTQKSSFFTSQFLVSEILSLLLFLAVPRASFLKKGF
jgi:hypothetical protein